MISLQISFSSRQGCCLTGQRGTHYLASCVEADPGLAQGLSQSTRGWETQTSAAGARMTSRVSERTGTVLDGVAEKLSRVGSTEHRPDFLRTTPPIQNNSVT